MTTLQFVENTIRDEWQSSISGRPHDVGELGADLSNNQYIRLVYESDADWSQMDLANYDYLVLRDGGDVNIIPKSFGWTEEEVVSRVDVDIRTRGHPSEGRPGRIALYGERGAGNLGANERPRWGGLAGEVERTIKTVRKGEEEFDIINIDVIDDVSSQMGGQIWRAVVQIRFESKADVIDTTP